jgi:hypothetical protein
MPVLMGTLPTKTRPRPPVTASRCRVSAAPKPVRAAIPAGSGARMILL